MNSRSRRLADVKGKVVDIQRGGFVLWSSVKCWVMVFSRLFNSKEEAPLKVNSELRRFQQRSEQKCSLAECQELARSSFRNIFEFAWTYKASQTHFVEQPSGTYRTQKWQGWKTLTICNVLTVKDQPARSLFLFSPVMKSSCIRRLCGSPAERQTERNEFISLRWHQIWFS